MHSGKKHQASRISADETLTAREVSSAMARVSQSHEGLKVETASHPFEPMTHEKLLQKELLLNVFLFSSPSLLPYEKDFSVKHECEIHANIFMYTQHVVLLQQIAESSAIFLAGQSGHDVY